MDAAHRPSPNLMEVLRSTLESLERSTEVNHDDAALQEFKRTLLRMIADLQLRKDNKPNRPVLPKTDVGPRKALLLIVKPTDKSDPSQQ